MTLDQVAKVITEYEERLRELEARPICVEMTLRRPTEAQALNHALWMCVEMRTKLLVEPKVNEGKVARWLGFVQATLWVYDLYSIDDMRTHNR